MTWKEASTQKLSKQSIYLNGLNEVYSTSGEMRLLRAFKQQHARRDYSEIYWKCYIFPKINSYGMKGGVKKAFAKAQEIVSAPKRKHIA